MSCLRWLGEFLRASLTGLEQLQISFTLSKLYCNFVCCDPGEAPEPECAEGDVRLVGGLSSSNGRVEVCHGGVWGSVCLHDWDDHETRVVCNQIGVNGCECKVLPRGM